MTTRGRAFPHEAGGLQGFPDEGLAEPYPVVAPRERMAGANPWSRSRYPASRRAPRPRGPASPATPAGWSDHFTLHSKSGQIMYIQQTRRELLDPAPVRADSRVYRATRVAPDLVAARAQRRGGQRGGGVPEGGGWTRQRLGAGGQQCRATARLSLLPYSECGGTAGWRACGSLGGMRRREKCGHIGNSGYGLVRIRKAVLARKEPS
jgi:hypothetical protein